MYFVGIGVADMSTQKTRTVAVMIHGKTIVTNITDNMSLNTGIAKTFEIVKGNIGFRVAYTTRNVHRIRVF